MEFLREQITLLRRFWRAELRQCVPVSALTLVFSAVVGAIACLASPELGDEMVAAFQSMATESGSISSDGSLLLFSILYHNWTAVISIILYGALPFCYLPGISMFSNGILMGVTVAHFHNQGLSMALAVVGILPHGVFELPALALAGATGICLCRRITARAAKKVEQLNYAALLEDLLRALLFLVFPLLLLAAVTETYVTPTILSLFL